MAQAILQLFKSWNCHIMALVRVRPLIRTGGGLHRGAGGGGRPPPPPPPPQLKHWGGIAPPTLGYNTKGCLRVHYCLYYVTVYTVEPPITDILYNGHLPATDNSNCTNSLCHSHNTKEASLQRTPLCSG